MKLYQKLLTLFLVSILLSPLSMADTRSNDTVNATVNDNYTIGTNTTDETGTSTAIEENTSADSTPVEQRATPVVNNQVVVNNNVVVENHGYEKTGSSKHTAPINPQSVPENVKKILPSREDVLNFANNSNATDNATLEEQLIAHNESWYWDTYVVKTTDGTEYTVVVVYDNEKTKTDYGRVQLYASEKGVYQVIPEPMLICRPLNMIINHGDSDFTTATVKSYKIVKSYFGVDKKPVINPVVTEEKQLGCVVNNTTVPVKENTVIDNAAQVIENSTIENSTVTQNAGDQENNTNSVNNSKGVAQVVGNGNVVKQTWWENVVFELSNIKNSVINFNFGGN